MGLPNRYFILFNLYLAANFLHQARNFRAWERLVDVVSKLVIGSHRCRCYILLRIGKADVETPRPLQGF